MSAERRPGGSGARLPASLAWGSLLAWCCLLALRGRFFLPGPFLASSAAAAGGDEPEGGPPASVAAVVPARNEAELLGETLPALVAQRRAGLRVVVVDDRSSDATGEVARRILGPSGGLVVDGTPTPPGWAGKVWALQQGSAAAAGSQWLLFTDADVRLGTEVLGRLLALAGTGRYDVVSVMAELESESFFERLLVPSFVYFFAMLYPFRWVSGRTPAAAGGCLLVRADLLERSGGLSAMRGAIIDDVTLARQVASAGGRLWLGLDEDVRSLRDHRRLGQLWQMVARSAYTELDHSPLKLAGALAGLLLLFGVPPVATGRAAVLLTRSRSGGRRARGGPLARPGAACLAGGTAWLLQAASYLPTVRLYRLPSRWAASLPAAGLLYAAMTLSSALDHLLGRQVAWR